MKTRSIEDIIREMNDLAKAQGRYLGKAFWEIPAQPGSLLDATETPESQERIARLRARRLAREQRTSCPTDGQSMPPRPEREKEVGPPRCGTIREEEATRTRREVFAMSQEEIKEMLSETLVEANSNSH